MTINRASASWGRLARAIIFIVTAMGLAFAATGQTITPGFTFAVASPPGDLSVGSHMHSSSSGVYGNPAGRAEVGRYSSEEVRGLSEYKIAGLPPVSRAYVTFTVDKLAGLFAGTNGFPFSGTIQIVSYAGNNAEDTNDYQALATATIGTFSTTGLAAGNVLSFDVTTALNAAIVAGNPSFGIRLAAVPLNTSGALTFRDFNLTANSQCTAAGGCGTSQTINTTSIPIALEVGKSGGLSATATSGLPVAFSSVTPSTCTVAGSTVSAVAVGTCTVAFDQPGDSTYNPAPQVTKSFSVTAASTCLSASAFAGHDLMDVWDANGTVYLLTAVRKAGGSYFTDPDGTRSYQSELYLLKISSGGQLNKLKLGDFAPNGETNHGTGALRVEGQTVYAFSNSKEQNGTYSMSGHVYTVDASSMALTGKVALFTAANWGWYPVVRPGPQISHFSYAGYYRYLDTSNQGGVEPQAMIDEWAADHASHSGGLLQAGEVGDMNWGNRQTIIDRIVAKIACSSPIPTAGLVGYWSFDQGNANLTGGSANSGTPTSSGVTFGPGKSGGGALFGGVNNPGHIRIPNSAALQFDTGATYSVWVRLDSLTGMDGWGQPVTGAGYQDTLWAKSHDRAGAGFVFGILDNKETRMGIGTYESWVQGGSGSLWTPSKSVGDWTHVATTLSSTAGFKIYIDGRLYSQGPGPVSFASMNAQDLYLGKFSDAWYPLHGALDEMRVYNRVLGEAEITALAGAGGTALTPQTIAFGPAPSIVAGGTGTVSATASSGLPVTFSSQTTGTCTVSGSTVTGVDAGICTIGADQAGDSTYVPAPRAVQSFSIGERTVVPPGSPTISSITAGSGSATLNFSPPANTGGSQLVSYTASCSAGGQTTRTATGSGSPLTVRGLTGGVVYQCTLTATNGAGLTSDATPSVAVTPRARKNSITPILMLLLGDDAETTPARIPPTMPATTPPSGKVGEPYSFAYTATGSAPIRFSASALPPGLSMSGPGVISGTPTAAGTTEGTVTASNGIPPDATQRFSIEIRAAAEACTTTLSSYSQSVGPGEQTLSIAVTTPATCEWAAASNAGWIFIISGESGRGSGVVDIRVEPNTTATSRTGTLSIGGVTFSVTQASAAGCVGKAC